MSPASPNAGAARIRDLDAPRGGPRLRRWAWLLLIPACYILYFHGLDEVGLLGPDEPRYAAIGREMATSGDWVTPRLWGEPWFEKPPLAYWMSALAFRLGLNEDLAPRIPVALAGLAFLVFYYRTLRREFGAQAAWFATAILGTSAGWLAFTHVGVTDLPLTAAFSAAMLLSVPWIARGERRGLTAAGALLGLAVLAKGLVPLALALPAFWAGRRRLKDWFRLPPLLAFAIVAAPWYILVTLRHGRAFLDEFFLKHHFGRLYAETLQHVQPFWFYVPVLLAGLLPWTPVLALLFRRKVYEDARARFLLAWFAFGLVFFSVSVNKLPGYLLPLMPAVSALCGLGLAQAGKARGALAAAAVLLAVIPLAAEILPPALVVGITHTQLAGTNWPAVAAALALAAWVWWEAGRSRERAVAILVAGAAGGLLLLQVQAFPVLDRQVSVRAFWREISRDERGACVERVDRERRYGLSYYSIEPLPDCGAAGPRLRIIEDASGRLAAVR